MHTNSNQHSNYPRATNSRLRKALIADIESVRRKIEFDRLGYGIVRQLATDASRVPHSGSSDPTTLEHLRYDAATDGQREMLERLQSVAQSYPPDEEEPPQNGDTTRKSQDGKKPTETRASKQPIGRPNLPN